MSLLTLITPTGDRHLAFDLCELWMSRQHYDGLVQWIVVDDGHNPTRCTMSQTVVRREPGGGRHTLPANLRAALPLIEGDVVCVIEDDDHYPPDYLAHRMALVRLGHPMVGEADYRVYHVAARRGGKLHYDTPLSSLSRTAIRTDLLLASNAHAFECCCIDGRLWQQYGRESWYQPIDDPSVYVVSMKGMPGRRGLTDGHDPTCEIYGDDPDGELLKQWLGEDADIYLSIGRQ